MSTDHQLSHWPLHQSRCRRFLLQTYTRERWRSQRVLFFLHINDMLEDSSIHCYADDSTVDAVYAGQPSLSRENVDQCRNKLVCFVEASLENVSSWAGSIKPP